MSKMLLLFVCLCTSCMSIDNLPGKIFSYKSKQRKLELIFDSDSVCRIKNTFYCSDIDSQYKEQTTFCIYTRSAEKIYVKNANCKDTCEQMLTINMPIQNSVSCSFLNEDARKNKGILTPNYKKDYDKYGVIPFIDLDTMTIVKNKIVFYKQHDGKSIGCIFK